jgi:hypothetical protein
MRKTLFILAMLALQGCAPSKAHTVSIDGWWDDDFAKNACYAVKQYDHVGCLADPISYSRQVETSFKSAFQSNPACRGVRLIDDFHDPNRDAAKTKIVEADWSLMLNTGMSPNEGFSEKESTWQVIRAADSSHYAEGSMADPYRAASQVCTVILGKGGSQ